MTDSTPPIRMPDQALQALAVAAHEVRGGLAGIIAHARLLEEPGLSDERRTATLRVIERNGMQLLDLFDRVLQSARSDAGSDQVVPEEGDLRSLVEDSVELFHAKANQHGVAIHCEVASDLPAMVRFDPRALRRVLGNLIGNAVKFTNQGSIRVVVGGGEDESVRIEVIDTGCGIPATDHERIFEPFERGDHPGGSGVGLGLALSRRLVESMNGTLTVRSHPGTGSTFRVEWPLRLGGFIGPEALSGWNVLVVDDCADARALLAHQLKGFGARVRMAVDGHQALDLVRDSGFDLVLVDLEMPVMNGWETAAEIRRLGFDRPVIALSAHASPDLHQRAVRAGCTGCITKPISPESLAHTLLSHLQLPSARLAG